MKKLLVLSAVLISAAATSHAGVRFGFGVGLPVPLPPLPGIVIGQSPAYAPAPPPVCYDAPGDYGGPAVVLEPPTVYFGARPGYYRYSYPQYRGRVWEHRDYRRGWDQHGRHGHDGRRW